MVKRSGLFEKKGLTFRCKLSFTHGGLLQNLMQEKYGSYTKMYTDELMFLKLVVSQEVFLVELLFKGSVSKSMKAMGNAQGLKACFPTRGEEIAKKTSELLVALTRCFPAIYRYNLEIAKPTIYIGIRQLVRLPTRCLFQLFPPGIYRSAGGMPW